MAARSKSASASTTEAFCPPISAWTLAPRPAARATTSCPAGTDPVNDTAATPGWPVSARPVSPAPRTTWNTSGGRCGARISASIRATADDSSDGFSTVALPNARLGAAFHSGIATGKFHGVTRPVTPTGRRRAISRVPGLAAGRVSPSGSSAPWAK